MYSRNRYDRERGALPRYTPPPRYDGNTFRTYRQSPRLTSGVDEVKAAVARQGLERTETAYDDLLSEARDVICETSGDALREHEASYVEPEQFAYGSGESIVGDRTQAEPEDNAEHRIYGAVPDTLAELITKIGYDDILLSALILVLSGENSGDCTSVIIALLVLLALR